MCDENIETKSDPKVSELKAVYKLAVQTRNFEIQQLINRNNFFMLFQGVLLAAVFSNQTSKPYVEFIISVLGIFISIHQVKVAAGAKYWQEWWELKTSKIEVELKNLLQTKDSQDNFITLFNMHDLDHELNREVKEKIENQKGIIESICNKLILAKYSVSRMPIRSGLILMITWILLMLSTLNLAAIYESFFSFNLIDGMHFNKNQ